MYIYLGKWYGCPVGGFVVLLEDYIRGRYGFAARTRLLGKPVQTTVTLSAPVFPILRLAIRGGLSWLS